MQDPKFVTLKLKNFKSYRDETSFHWKQASAIVGLNGVGKSSIVDAIEFVLSFRRFEKDSVEHLERTIKCFNNSDETTWVQATFKKDDNLITFKRSINYKDLKQNFVIDDTVVKLKEYRKYLRKFNINYNANNFVVQQESVEKIAVRNKKERCQFFEILSGSVELKKDYDRISKDKNRCFAEYNELNVEYKQLEHQMNNVLKSLEEIEKYEEFQQEINDLKHIYNLTKLFQCEKNIENEEENMKELEMKINITQKLKDTTETNVEELKQQLIEPENELKDINQEFDTYRDKISKLKSEEIQLKENKLNYENNLLKIKSKLEKEIEKKESCKKNIKNLTEQYNQVAAKRDEAKSQSQSDSMHLDDEEYEEYLKLKLESQKILANDLKPLDSLSQQLETLKDKKEDFEREINSLEMKKKFTSMEYEKICSNFQSVLKNIEDSKAQEIEIYTHLKESAEKIENLLKNDIDVSYKLEKINELLGDYQINHVEEKKAARRREILKKLKQFFPGLVHDRINCICDVGLDDKYQVAMAKIIGNKMNNIVVENTQTAQKCIEFIKSQYDGGKWSVVETFLPLDYIVHNQSSNRIRRLISDKPNYILAIDLMGHLPQELIGLLHHHIFKNIVICENDEDASELSLSEGLDCVSLNGTLYRKDGIISGGLATIAEKSKQLNEKTYTELINKKENLSCELRNLKMHINKEEQRKFELESKLKPLELKLQKYLEPLLKETLDKKENLEMKLTKMEEEIESLKNNQELILLQNSIEELKKKSTVLEQKKTEIENNIFKDFCQKYNVNDIHSFENCYILVYKDNKAYIEECDNHLNKIENEIQYEKSYKQKMKDEIQSLEKTFEQKKEELDMVEKNLQKKKKEIDKKNKRYQAIAKKSDEIKKTIAELEKNLTMEKFKYKSMKKDIKEWSSCITNIKSKLINLKTKKHDILLDCKINGINIPLLNGRIDQVIPKLTTNILDSESGNSSQQSSETSSHLQEKEIIIDYSKLDELELDLSSLDNYLKELYSQINFMEQQINETFPNFKLTQNVEDIRQKIKSVNSQKKKKYKELNELNKKFDKIKDSRLKKFNEVFSSVESKVDKIFKKLYQDNAAQAHLVPLNGEEPYLDGIDFSVVTPKKRFTSIDHLSGGEKTMAAVALLLAGFSVKPAPFLIFDEIDAALDTSNINRIVNYFTKLKSSTQFIVISHHMDLFFRCANVAIAININPNSNSSQVLHIELEKYQRETVENKSLRNTIEEKIEKFVGKINRQL